VPHQAQGPQQTKDDRVLKQKKRHLKETLNFGGKSRMGRDGLPGQAVNPSCAELERIILYRGEEEKTQGTKMSGGRKERIANNVIHFMVCHLRGRMGGNLRRSILPAAERRGGGKSRANRFAGLFHKQGG